MTDHDFTRRASYGPSSPTIGTRGARTRQQILDVALDCFTKQGFHATAVETIAAGANTSRATLYQYFESKEAIFIELMRHSAGALNRVTRRLGDLGATADGYDNLHWWLGEWTWVYDRYSAMFIEWANVNSQQAPLRPKLIDFVDSHTERFITALERGDYRGPDAATDSLLALALFTRFNYIRHVYRPGLTEAQLLDSLATAIQIFLFPETSQAVLAAGPRRAQAGGSTSTDRPPIARLGPLAQLPGRDSIQKPTPFAGYTQQAARTIRQLLDAAGRVFGAHGYDGASIDQIVTEAGLARGTFYRYFTDKLELITALSWEAASVMTPMFDDFATCIHADDPASRIDWLHRFLRAQREYSGVLRAWTEGIPIDPVLLAPAGDVIASMGSAIELTFGPPRAYALDRRAAGMLFSGLLENFPNEGTGSQFAPSEQQIVEAQARFIDLVLVGDDSAERGAA